MRVVRSYFSGFRAIAVALMFPCGIAGPASAGPAVVFDTATGEVLHAHLATTRWHPASLTKLMTAYVTFQAIDAGRIGLDSTVTIGANPKAITRTWPTPGLGVNDQSPGVHSPRTTSTALRGGSE